MTIKKLVVGSMFSMLLGSEIAVADWGDVYYCQMTENVKITLDGEMTKYKLQKFQFKLDQTKNAMVFGSTGSFGNEVIELVTGRNWPRQERWYANDKYSMTYFDEGRFSYALVSLLGTHSISADCDKF